MGVTAVVCLGGLLAVAESPEPIGLPDPRRMIVTARLVESGEFIVYDPLAFGFAPTRRMPDAVALPRQRRIAVAARMDSIDIAVPDPHGIGVALRFTEAKLKMPATRRLRAAAWRHAPEIVLIIKPLAMTAVIQRHVYEADLYPQLVQSFLKDRGYDPGPVDGLIGKRTRRAIASFKADMASSGAISDADRGLLELIEGLPK